MNKPNIDDSDIVARLRDPFPSNRDAERREAADEIERLRIQLKEARKTEETENPIATAMRTTLRNLGYSEAKTEELLRSYNI